MPFEPIRTDVEFVVNTPVVKASLAQVREAYAATTGAMSDDAIKMSLAQERLQRSIERTGVSSAATQRAALNYRQTTAAIAAANVPAAAPSTAERLKTIEPAARMAGRAITTYVTAPVAILGYEATKMGIEFKRQMLLIQTQAGASAGEVQRMSKAVLELAKTAPQGPTELAQGLYHLESVGLRDQRALDALRTSSMAAGMGIADLETTTSALGAALVSGVKGAQSAAQAMGTLNATIGAGNMRMQDLGEALGTEILPKAKNAGVSLDEVGAALATLTDRGVPAQKAATQLGTTFALMMAPSKAAEKALADMGISAHQLRDELAQPNGLLKVLETLQAGMDRVGKGRGATDILSAFGRSRQSGAILTLVESLDNKLSGYQTKLKQVDSTQGQFATDLVTYQHSAAYKLAADWSTIQADLIKLGDAFEPVATTAVGAITKIVDAVDKLPGPFKAEFGIIIGLLAVGGPVLIGLAAVTRAVKTMGTAFGLMQKQATVAIATTDGELLTLGRTATTTEAKVAALAGTEGAAGGIEGVATASLAARGKVLLLSRSLGALGAITIAPIVIPLEVEWAGSKYNPIKGLMEGQGAALAGPDLTGPAAGRNAIAAAITAAEAAYAQGKSDGQVADLLANRGFYSDMPETATIIRLAKKGYMLGPKDVTSGVGQHGALGKEHYPGPAASGGPGNAPAPKPSYKPSRLALLNRQLAKNPNSVDAIKAKLAYDEEAIAFALKEINSGKLSPKRGAQVEQELEGLYGDENQLQQQLQSIAQQAAEKEKQRRANAKKAVQAVAKQRLKQITRLENVPVAGPGSATELANAIANGASDQRLLAIYRQQRKALDEQLKQLKAMGATQEQKLKNRPHAADVQKKIDQLTKPKKSAGSDGDFFTEAANEEKLYGSNIGPVLSPQDARRLLAEIALNTRRTAGHTGTISKRRPRTAADDVSDASSHGY